MYLLKFGDNRALSAVVSNTDPRVENPKWRLQKIKVARWIVLSSQSNVSYLSIGLNYLLKIVLANQKEDSIAFSSNFCKENTLSLNIGIICKFSLYLGIKTGSPLKLGSSLYLGLVLDLFNGGGDGGSHHEFTRSKSRFHGFTNTLKLTSHLIFFHVWPGMTNSRQSWTSQNRLHAFHEKNRRPPL